LLQTIYALRGRCIVPSLPPPPLLLLLLLPCGAAVVSLFYGVICAGQTDHIQVRRTTAGTMQMTKIGATISTPQNVRNRDWLGSTAVDDVCLFDSVLLRARVFCRCCKVYS